MCLLFSHLHMSPAAHSLLPLADASSLALVAEKANAHSRNINSVAYNNDGTSIVSACNGGTIKVWGVLAFLTPAHEPCS